MTSAPTLQRVIDLARPIVEAGASLHWLVPFDKMPIGKDWSSTPTLTLDHLRAAHRPEANIGIRPGAWSKIGGRYLHILDVDIRKADQAEEAWRNVEMVLPAARRLPSVISGSGGASRHVYFLTDKPFNSKKLIKSEGWEMVFDPKKGREVKKHDWEIDLKGTGTQAVIPPSIHPESRQPYRWERPLELDFPLLMHVASASVETWGGRTTVARDDADDLEIAIAAEPKDFTDAEVQDFLNDLPEGWVEDRENWLTVGQALHHQYRGSDEGFSIWCDWSEQSEKFDERDAQRVWKSIRSDVTNPVTMLTVRRVALDHRLASDLDLESDDGFDSAPTSVDLTTVSPPATSSLTDLLSGATAVTSVTSSEIAAPTVSVSVAPKVERNADFISLLARTEDGDIKSNAYNTTVVFANDIRTHGIAQYNEFTKEIVLRKKPGRVKKKQHSSAKDVVNLEGRLWGVENALDGTNWTDSHDHAVRIMLEAPTTCGGYGYKVSDRDLRAAVDDTAHKHSFHPVRDTLNSFKWDGVKRCETLFIDYLGCDDTTYHRQAAILMLLGAVARIFEPGHKFDFVAILEGVQGKGKSTFVKILALHWFAELTGDISDPQEMVGVMAGAWLMEIGELSSMHRSEANDLKAFVSRTHDKARPPYGKRAVVYPRQCIFIGSTNDTEYLRDQTGNRRYWPIKCNLDGQIDNTRLATEVAQIWAEAVEMYRAMRQRYPTGELPLHITDAEAQIEARAAQEARLVETPEDVLAGKLQVWLDTPIHDDNEFDDLDPDAPKVLRDHTCTAELWEKAMEGRSGHLPHAETVKIGKAMLALGWTRTANWSTSFEVNKRYGRCRVYVRPRAED